MCHCDVAHTLREICSQLFRLIPKIDTREKNDVMRFSGLAKSHPNMISFLNIRTCFAVHGASM